MAGGVIVSAISEEGFPYFVQEVKNRVNFFKLRQKFLPQISQWIAAANALMTDSTIEGANRRRKTAKNNLTDQERLYHSVFSSYYQNDDEEWVEGPRNAVTSSGAPSKRRTGLTLKMQWNNVVSHNRSRLYNQDSKIYDANFFRRYDVLKQGYRILTQIGEVIRGDEITYKIVMRGQGIGMGGAFGATWEYNTNLQKFLKYGGTDNRYLLGKTTMENLFRADLKLTDSNSRLYNNLDNKRQWDPQEEIDIDWFISQVRGYIEWHGGGPGPAESKMSSAVHPYADANKGQILEAYLQSGYTAKWLRSPSEADWKGLIKDYMAMAKGETSAGFAAFWQGGEGGTNLANIQVKGRYASITSLKTLVRQMTRVYAFMNEATPEQFVNDAKANFMSNSAPFQDERAIEQLIKMFYSTEFLQNYQITIPI